MSIPNFLVTGSEGYIGSHFVKYLEQNVACNIVEVDYKNDESHHMHYEGNNLLNNRYYPFEMSESDIRVYDAVFHFAAISNVDECNRSPFESLAKNVKMTWKLIDIFTKSEFRAKNFIFASSAAVYEPTQEGVYSEFGKLVSGLRTGSYGYSKAVCEQLIHAAHIEYGMKYASLRFSNVTGQAWGCTENHVPETHLIPKLVRDEEIEVYGSLGNIRDYIDIRDVCEGIYRAYQKLSTSSGFTSGPLNISSGIGYSVEEVIKLVEKVKNINIGYKVVGKRHGDSNKLVLENSLARNTINFSTKYTLEESIGTY